MMRSQRFPSAPVSTNTSPTTVHVSWTRRIVRTRNTVTITAPIARIGVKPRKRLKAAPELRVNSKPTESPITYFGPSSSVATAHTFVSWSISTRTATVNRTARVRVLERVPARGFTASAPALTTRLAAHAQVGPRDGLQTRDRDAIAAHL